MEEIEVKFLDIDVKAMQKKLANLGASKMYDRIFKDRVFDFPGWPLAQDKAWVRLRDKGDKVTLSYKQRFGESEAGDAGMNEVEIIVNDFEQTSELLQKIGMVVKFDEEKRREHFELNGTDVDIDTYPLIPSYLEVEGKDWDEIKKVVGKLGMKWSERKQIAAMQVFRNLGINENDYRILTFDQQIKRD